MIRILFLFILLGLGLYVGAQYTDQQGYALLSAGGKTIEMSVTAFVILMFLVLMVLFGLELIIKKILSFSSDTRNWFSVRKLKRSRRFTNEGILKLMEGDWKQAEKKVTKWAKHHDMPLLCYLIAAQAAQEQGKTEKRERYLSLASEQDNSLLAVELTRAKLFAERGDYQHALTALKPLSFEYYQNPVLLKLLKDTYVQLGQWESLLSLLPNLKRGKQLTDAEELQLTEKSYCGLLSDTAQQRGNEGLLDRWNDLPKTIRFSEKVRGHLVQLLIARNASNEALELIQEYVKKYPETELYSLLPQLELSDNAPAIELTKKVLAKNDSNANALSALGRLYLEEKRWPEAQTQLEKALSLRSSVSDYGYLADALVKQNKHQAAHDVSKKALSLITE